MMEARVILLKCYSQKKLFGVRTQKMENGDWQRTWAFPINESKARYEKYDQTQICGSLTATDEYPGCPYCKNIGIVVCSCGNASCWNGKDTKVKCTWCGKTSRIEISDSIDVKTNSF